MERGKDTHRALVKIGYDGRVYKTFRGFEAKERFENEVKVLKYLEKQGCSFVPKVLEMDADTFHVVTTNCGKRVELISEKKLAQIFFELEQFGVRHEDRDQRNVTYRAQDGRFCVIDFEYATILADTEHRSPLPMGRREEG